MATTAKSSNQMTVKELFLSIGFDNVLNALRNTHRKDRSIVGGVAYKEAFDIICLTEFEGDGGDVTFDVTPRAEWDDPESLPLLARNVEGDYWKKHCRQDCDFTPDYCFIPDNNKR